MHFNLVNNSYHQASKVLFIFVPNKQFGQLITISPPLLTMLKTTNRISVYSIVVYWSKYNRPLEVEDCLNITLVIG